jgi:hypothetical protein
VPKFFHRLVRERVVKINYSLLPTLFSPTGSFVVEEQKMQQAGKRGNRAVIAERASSPRSRIPQFCSDIGMQIPFEELSEHIDCVKDLVTRDEDDLGLRGLAKVNIDIDRQMRELMQKLRRLDA